MLNATARKAIYQAIPTSFTINSVPVNVSHIYSSQIPGSGYAGSYPVITLNYINEGLTAQPVAGNYTGQDGQHGFYYYATLSINILAKPISGLGMNYVELSKEIARLLEVDMLGSDWTDLGGAQFLYKSPTRDLTHIEQTAGALDIARQQFDAFIQYNMLY